MGEDGGLGGLAAASSGHEAGDAVDHRPPVHHAVQRATRVALHRVTGQTLIRRSSKQLSSIAKAKAGKYLTDIHCMSEEGFVR